MAKRRRSQQKQYVTIKDVAKLAETSIATVSYVLDDSKERYISDALRARVLKAADELNYIKSGLASSLKGKERGIIAVLTPQFENHFFLDVFIAIEKIANKYGYVLSTCNTFDDVAHEKEVLDRMIRLRADGYIIIPTAEGAKNMEMITNHNLPFVVVERTLDGINEYDLITSDNYEATYAITEHLLEQGHREIGFLYWDTDVSNLYERYQGYEQALESYGVKANQDYIRKGDITREEGARLTQELLENNKEMTAIVFGHYILAEGGIEYIRSKGMKIPEDISVVLVGAPDWTQMNEVKFTCARQPGDEIGKIAAKILLRRIEARDLHGEYAQEKVKSTIVFGDSVKRLK